MMLASVSCGMSEPGSRIVADLPPSSSTSRLVVRDADCMILRPTPGDPGNTTMSTASGSDSSWPVSESPIPKLTTPGGSPTCSHSLTSAIVDSGVRGEGLNTIVQPDARPGPGFHTTELIGKL